MRCCHYKLQEYGKNGGTVFMQLYGKTSQTFFNNYNERIHTDTQRHAHAVGSSQTHIFPLLGTEEEKQFYIATNHSLLVP
jgi:hypothetical protein